MTREQIDERKKEITEIIKKKKSLMYDLIDEEQARKIDINSQYGAMANEGFMGFDTRLADSVTSVGRELNEYMSKAMNKYFNVQWLVDTELHQKLGVRLRPDAVPPPRVRLYNDTDSGFFDFGIVIDTIEPSSVGDPVDLILNIFKYRLNDYIKHALDLYAKRYNTVNLQEFELENISDTIILMAKKKYAQRLCFSDPNIRYGPNDPKAVIIKGLEIVQASTPLFCRKHLKEVVEYVLSAGYSYDVLVKKVIEIRSIYEKQEIDYISKTTQINDYHKYVADDKLRVVLLDKTQVHLRAAANYNYSLYNANDVVKSNYMPLGQGDKIKWYYSLPVEKHVSKRTAEVVEVYGYHPGNFPTKLNPPKFDYRTMFHKTFIEPLNSILSAIGDKEISIDKAEIISLL